MSRVVEAGNARKVSNYGRWEAIITTPEGNIGKAYGENKAEVRADAQMFAAAWEMLDALRSAHAWMRDNCDDSVESYRELDLLLARIDASVNVSGS